MSKNKIVVLSDVHIGTDARTNWYQSSLHGPYLHAILDYVVANAAGIRTLVLLGDIVDFWTYPSADTPPSMADIARVQSDLFGANGKFDEVVAALGGDAVYVIGNHDMGLKQESVNLMTSPEHPIRFVGNVYQPFGDTSLVLTHGNDFVMANAPDTFSENTFAPLPIGYFVTRTIATYFIKKGLKKGQTVADLPNVGTPLDASYFNYYKKVSDELLKGIIDPSSFSVAKVLLDGLISSVKMTDAEVSPYRLPDGRQAMMNEVHAAYWSLFSAWRDRVGIEAAVDSLRNDLDEDLSDYATRLAGDIAANAIAMGHTHVAVNTPCGTASRAAYVNSGFECASMPDLPQKPPTFAVIEWDDVSFTTRVLAATRDAGGPVHIGEAPNLPPQSAPRARPLPAPGAPLARGSLFTLASLFGTRVSRMERSGPDQFYPTLGVESARWVMLRFDGDLSGEPLRTGATVQLRTIETTVGAYDRLGAWETPALYYYALDGGQPYDKELWILHKADTSADDVIHYGDAVYVENAHYDGQLMQISDPSSLTTIGRDSVVDFERPRWFFREPVVKPGDRAIRSGHGVTVMSADMTFVTKFRQELPTNQYFPTLGDGEPVWWYITNEGGGTLRHGDDVFVETRESGVGAYDRVGAFSDRDIYYYESGYEQQRWQIQKLDPTDADLHAGEPFALFNPSAQQYMSPDGGWITTRDTPAWWFASV